MTPQITTLETSKLIQVLLSPEQNGSHFANSTFKYIFFNWNYCILIQISLKFLPKDAIDNKSILVIRVGVDRQAIASSSGGPIDFLSFYA